MKLTDDQIQEVADDLQGTCMRSISDVVLELYGIQEDELTAEDLVAIEEFVFECSRCGWWNDGNKEEVLDEVVCDSCANDFDEESEENEEYDDHWCDDCDNATEDCECEH